MKNRIIIAIDGPAGSGKSSVAKEVARRLGFLYLDSGAIYRAVTLLFLKEKLDFSDQNEQISFLLKKCDIQLFTDNGRQRVSLNGEDITTRIRSQEVTRHVSAVSELVVVRKAVTGKLRQMSEHVSVVMDGRDIGTIVFPDADLKIYLNATIVERAQRRYKEMIRAGQKMDLDSIKNDIARRDKHDSQRAAAPLAIANDAIEFDTTNKTIEDGVNFIINNIQTITLTNKTKI